MRRRIVAGILVLAAAASAYLLLFGTSTVEPRLTVGPPTSMLGSGEGAVGVSASGVLLVRQPPPADGTLPELPLSEPPKGGHLAGPVLEQAKVLGAAPAPIRPCIEGTYFGESGVDVVLDSGIELRFGDASRAAEKWRAAAAVLADPSISALDYVDLHAPGRPSFGGSGHTLPSFDEASGSGCGD